MKHVMLGILIVLGLVAALAAAGAWLLLVEAPPGDGTEVEVTIEAGQPFAEVAAQLERERLVRSAPRLQVLARLAGLDRRIHAGTFRLQRGTRPYRLLEDLAHGRVVLHRVTVREGWRLDQIAVAVQDSLAIPAAAFLEAARDSSQRARVGAPGPDVEGYLFPDTYLFPDGVTAAVVVGAMLDRFDEVWGSLERADGAEPARHRVVTLASIVEAETPLPEEKPRVAAVYLNRLEQGWKLQADPTVRYGLGYWVDHLYYKQLEIDTPYNTYLHAGLPPGPIGAPGREALQAVLAPLRPCDDLYFVASGQGGHVFSRTKVEHDRARRAAKRAASG